MNSEAGDKGKKQVARQSGRGFDYKNAAAKLFCFSVISIGAYFALKYLFVIILPFIIAWTAAVIIKKPSEKIGKKLHIPVKLCATALMFIFIAVITFVLVFAVNRIIFETEKLFLWLSDEENGRIIGEKVTGFFDGLGSLGERLPFLENLRDIEYFDGFFGYIDNLTENFVGDITAGIGERIPTVAADIVRSMPAFLLFLIITVASCFYFCAGIDKINSFMKSLLPQRVKAELPSFVGNLGGAAVKYFRAYFLLMMLTFGELFLGLSLLRVNYAFLLALLIAVIDILPVFGTGTVLIPWAAVMLLSKNYYMGFGLLIIYGCITIIRQFAEPKIVGDSLGLNPVATLVAIYVGFRLFGIVGMLLAPIGVLIIKQIYDSYIARSSDALPKQTR